MCRWDRAHDPQILLTLNLEATLQTELKIVITDTIVRTLPINTPLLQCTCSR